MNPSDGVMKKSGRDRYAIDVDLQYRLKQFTFRNQLAYDYVKAFNSPYGSFSSYTRLNPYYRYRDEDVYKRQGWNRTGSLINRYKITEELLSGAFRIPCEFNFQILNYESRYQYFVSGNSRCDGIYLFFSRRVYFFVWRRWSQAGCRTCCFFSGSYLSGFVCDCCNYYPAIDP